MIKVIIIHIIRNSLENVKATAKSILHYPACTIDRDSRSDFGDRDSRSDFF